MVDIIDHMIKEESHTLADFGLYISVLKDKKFNSPLTGKINRASLIIEGYRIKHELSSEPHRNMTL